MRRVWPPLALLAGLRSASGSSSCAPRTCPDYLFPAPTAVAAVARATTPALLGRATLVTLREMVLGYLLAVVVALAIAVAAPLLGRAAPRAAADPRALADGADGACSRRSSRSCSATGSTPKLVVVAVVCFFPIVVNAVDGLRSTDPELVRMMRTLHGGRLAIFRRVELPGALPAIFSGARIAATYAAVGAVFGEWAGSSSGLGFVMLQAQPALETARIFAAVARS